MATQKTTSAAKAAKADGATRQMLQVTPRRDGFRRAGREWHGTTAVALDELTEEQFDQLTNEPMLVTQLFEVPADQVDELTAPGGAGAETAA